jgi:hypothetical protein
MGCFAIDTQGQFSYASMYKKADFIIMITAAVVWGLIAYRHFLG